MKVHISPIGTRTDEHIRKAIQYFSVDKLYLVPSKESLEKAQNLKAELEKLFLNMEIIITDEINPFDLDSISNMILEIAKKEIESKNEVFINITGGTNLMAGAATVAAYISGSKAYYVLNPQDRKMGLEEQIVMLPLPGKSLFSLLNLDPKRRKMLSKILKLIHDRGEIKMAKELSYELKLTKSTISHHMKRLVRMGFVEEKIVGREKRYVLTNYGRLIAKYF